MQLRYTSPLVDRGPDGTYEDSVLIELQNLQIRLRGENVSLSVTDPPLRSDNLDSRVVGERDYFILICGRNEYLNHPKSVTTS